MKIKQVQAADNQRAAVTSIEVGDHVAIISGGHSGSDFLLATSDGKHLHKRSTPPRGSMRGLKYIAGQLWSTGEYGHLAVSDDNADSWTAVNIATSACLWDIAIDKKGTYWIAGSEGFLGKGDGKTFKEVKHTLKPRDERADPRVETTPAGVVFPVFNAIWDGKKLDKLKGVKGPMSALAKSDIGTWVIVGDKGAAFRSTDGGATWKAVKTGVPGDFNDIGFVDGAFVAIGTKGLVRVSFDDGVTWKHFVSGTQLDLWSIGSWGGGAYIGGEQGLVLRLDGEHDQYWDGRADDFAPKPIEVSSVKPPPAPSAADRDKRFKASAFRGRAG